MQKSISIYKKIKGQMGANPDSWFIKNAGDCSGLVVLGEIDFLKEIYNNLVDIITKHTKSLSTKEIVEFNDIRNQLLGAIVTLESVYGSLTKVQFDAEIRKGMEDIREGRVYSADAVEEEMRRDYGI